MKCDVHGCDEPATKQRKVIAATFFGDETHLDLNLCAEHDKQVAPTPISMPFGVE